MIASNPRPTLARKSPRTRQLLEPRASRLKLFGGGALDTDFGPVTGRAAQRHRIALLSLLATTRRLYRSREQVIALLWPDASTERGRKLLSDSIYRINRALGGDAITGTVDDVRLDRALLGSDVADFEAALDSRDWRRAVDVYAGPFLDGFFLPNSSEFDQWMETQRAEYARNVAVALEALATDARDVGRSAESANWWQRLAALAPDDSRIAMECMRALEAAGNRAGALRHGRAHSAYLRDMLGVDPDRSVVGLIEHLRARPCDHALDAPVASTVPPAGRAIGVLPFDNVSDSESNSYFADGLSEELMYLLTRVPGVRVASRTSSFACRGLALDVREVARRLQVDWIVEGSVRRAGDSVRVSAQLIDARTGFQIWSDSFDRAAADLFAMQGQIAAAIAERISPALSGQPAPALVTAVPGAADADTYDLYFQARFQANRRTEDSLRKAAELFERIVAREPENARSWTGLAETYAILAFYDYVAPRIAFPRAESAAQQAIRLDPSLGGPHATRGYVETFYHWNWAAAEAEFQRAIELEPHSATAHHWYGTMLSARGRCEEAVRAMCHAAQLDPLAMITHSATGWSLALADENDKAIRHLRAVLNLNPDFCLAHYWMGIALQQNGQSHEAIAILRRSIEIAPDSVLQRAALAHALASAGEIEPARAMLDDLLDRERGGRYISSYQIAKVHLALGEVPAALARLERAYADRAHAMAYLRVDPQLRALAEDPRFQRLVAQVG